MNVYQWLEQRNYNKVFTGSRFVIYHKLIAGKLRVIIVPDSMLGTIRVLTAKNKD